MIRRLALYLACRSIARGRVKTILSRDGKRPYLTRVFLFGSDTSTGFRLCVHFMHESDEGAPHDHPFAFLSYILWGGFMERMKHRTVWRKPGSIYLRGMRTFHKVECPSGRTAATLVLMLPKWRVASARSVWGFLVGRKWMSHAQYLRVFYGRTHEL